MCAKEIVFSIMIRYSVLCIFWHEGKTRHLTVWKMSNLFLLQLILLKTVIRNMKTLQCFTSWNFDLRFKMTVSILSMSMLLFSTNMKVCSYYTNTVIIDWLPGTCFWHSGTESCVSKSQVSIWSWAWVTVASLLMLGSVFCFLPTSQKLDGGLGILNS